MALPSVVTDPSLESAAVPALVAELVDIAAASRLDYTACLVAESDCPPSVGGECALGTDVLTHPRIFVAAQSSSSSFGFSGFAAGVTQHGERSADHFWHLTGGLRGNPWTFFAGSLRSTRRVGLEEHGRPVYGLHQSPREWHDTLRTTLRALGFAPSTADPSLFLRTDTSLPPFYVLVYVDEFVFATAKIEVLQLYGFRYSSPQSTPLPTGHSLSAPPSDQFVEPRGSYPELMGYLITSGMGLVLGGRGPVLLTEHTDASWVDDLATQRSSQGYTFSLGFGSVCWRSTCSSSVLSSSCEAEIHAGAMAAQELRWLTYLLTDLGERPRSSPVLTSGMGLVLGGRGPVLLTEHTDASWVDDLATQRSSQGYTFSLGFGSVCWRSTCSSSVLSSSCEAEIHAGAMAAQELRWLTYLLTDLGERPRSSPVLTKHIALRYFLARELQQRGQLCLAYVATRANTADIFTKAL
ncbi:unnamed protein product [Closterium sp. NIES-53]